MHNTRVALFSLFGFKVYADISWIFLAALVTWTLAYGVFPALYPYLSTGTYWLMGLAGALGLFISIILHELSHSLVARGYGLPIGGITLFIFGGVAEMTDKPPSPKAEGVMSIVGPLASYFLSAVFYIFYSVAVGLNASPALTGVLAYLSFINLALATFNLIPGFPLDGGRVLHAFLWAWKKDLRLATRIASTIGCICAGLMIMFGLLSLFTGYAFTGMWWCLLGFFLWTASRTEYMGTVIHELLKDLPVRRFMKSDPITDPPDISIHEFVDDYVYHYPHTLYPVMTDGHVTGCISVDRVRSLPRKDWDRQSVRYLLTDCTAASIRLRAIRM
jgi:Zn-dependent protease